GFGVKGGPYREEPLVAWLARRLRRPVKWISTRQEDLMTTQHSRGAASAGALTTTPPVGAYRGAGRPEAAFLIERLVDEAARTLGLDPVELRRRNLIPAGAFPYTTATGQVYDSGDYLTALDRALAAADYDGLRRVQAE